MSMIKSFIIISLFTIFQIIDAEEDAVQFIDHPQKNEYILQTHGTDKHKYGYELKENKHFHHTTTELDGVRLGCYGHVLEGKKYSTQYVADVKGYRPVYTYNVINVYPKSGGVREATFIGNFKEDKDKSENIRYFFPEGCRGDDSNIIIPAEKNPMPPPVIKTTPAPLPPSTPRPTTPATPPPAPRITTKKLVPQRVIPTTPRPAPKASPNQTPKNAPKVNPKPVPKQAPKANPNQTPKNAPKVNLKPVPKQTPKVVPKLPPKQTPKTNPTPTPNSPIFKKPIVVAPVPEAPKNTCEAKCCGEDDAIPKLVIPINLGTAKSGSCARYAKLVVPADSVGMESLKSLLSNPSELAKTIIKSFS